MLFQDYLTAVRETLESEGLTLNKAQVRTVVDTVFGEVAKSGEVRVSGFGSFKTKVRAARAERMGHHPKTGESVFIAAQPEKTYLAFKQAKAAV